MTPIFSTIGHSNHSLDEFMEMLRCADITMVIDVRTFPRSRTNPIFNSNTLPNDLAKIQIEYQHWPALGGRRSKQKQVDPELNAMWRVAGFHNYADYALSDEFGMAFDELIALGQQYRLAIMCSEAVWWRCHRRIITDYLLLNGHAVQHVMAANRIDVAIPNAGAQKLANGKVVYPAM